MIKPNCGSCQFWSQTDGEFGSCHRYPPQLVMEVDVKGGGPEYHEGSDSYSQDEIFTANNPETHWPQVHQHNWCGEFRPKSEQ